MSKDPFLPVPVIEDIHIKVYEAASQPGALDMANWHTCKSTHCRAGWVIHLAGPDGYKLARLYLTEVAARMIYAASGYVIDRERFYDFEDEALADMKFLADKQRRRNKKRARRAAKKGAGL